MNIIEIWSPKYSTNSVLVAKYKVTEGFNELIFTKAKHLDGMKFRIHSNVLSECPIISNGKIACYDVPFERLERVE